VLLEMEDAASDQIVRVLGQRFGFAVGGTVDQDAGPRFSGQLRGPLDRILEKVLRQHGHMIVRSAESSSGIREVMFLARTGSSVSAAPSASAQKGSSDEPAAVAAAPSPESSSPGSPTAPTAQPKIDPTLRQLEDIGRQIMRSDASRTIDARADSPIEGNAMLPTAQAPVGATGHSTPGDVGNVGDMQDLTQRALASVQALASSLRTVCLGRSCGH
jgi:hypothetical protein